MFTESCAAAVEASQMVLDVQPATSALCHGRKDAQWSPWQAVCNLHHLSMYWPMEAPARSCAPPSKRPKAETSSRELGYSSSMMRPMANSCRGQVQSYTMVLARADALMATTLAFLERQFVQGAGVLTHMRWPQVDMAWLA